MNNPINMIDPDGKEAKDWIKKVGSETWEYDSGIQSQTTASVKYGEGTSYKDDGGTFQGSYKGESVGTITLNSGGLQTWNGGSYQNKDLNLSPSSTVSTLPNPFMQNWYTPGGQANAILGTFASAGDLSSSTVKLTPHFFENAAAWTPGYKCIPTSVSKLAGGLSKLSFGLGVTMDAIGVYNYYKEGADSPNAVNPTKAAVNTGFGILGMGIPKIGLRANPIAAILYFGVDSFYPGGWTGDKNNEGALKKISGLTERNQEIVPNYNLYRDF
jgi:hypothetical protein